MCGLQGKRAQRFPGSTWMELGRGEFWQVVTINSREGGSREGPNFCGERLGRTLCLYTHAHTNTHLNGRCAGRGRRKGTEKKIAGSGYLMNKSHTHTYASQPPEMSLHFRICPPPPPPPPCPPARNAIKRKCVDKLWLVASKKKFPRGERENFNERQRREREKSFQHLLLHNLMPRYSFSLSLFCGLQIAHPRINYEPASQTFPTKLP